MKTPHILSGIIDFRLHFRCALTVTVRQKIVVFGFTLVAALCVVTTVLSFARHGHLNQLAVAFVVLGFLLFSLVLPSTTALGVWQMRRNNPTIRGQITFEISEAGLVSKGEAYHMSMTWDAFHKVVETKEFFLLYVSSGMAHMVPKAWCGSTDELADIRRIFRQAKGDAARLLP